MSEPDEKPFYDDVGTCCGTIETPKGLIEAVGLMYALPNSHIDDVYDERYMSLPTAKALLLDLRDAIEACEKHQQEDRQERGY